MQNKLSYRLGGGLGTKTNEVPVNLVQFELLSKRPYFEFARGENAGVRNGLIRHSPYPSVCQYGIFYNNGTGVDMSVITANQFDYHSTYIRTSKNPTATVRFLGAFQKYGDRHLASDFIAAESIEDFGDILEDLYIGRPITAQVKQTINPLLRTMSYAQLGSMGMQIINDFCNMEVSGSVDLDIQDIIDDQSSFENILDVCRSLVLIDVDAEANPYTIEDQS